MAGEFGPDGSAMDDGQDSYGVSEGMQSGWAQALEEDDEPAPHPALSDGEQPAAGQTPPAAAQPAGQTPPAAAQPAGEPKTALEEAEALAAARLAAEGQPPAQTPPAQTTPPAAQQPPAAAQPAGQTSPAQDGQQPPAAPALEMPETVEFGGEQFRTADLLEQYGNEIGALASGMAQSVINHALANGTLLRPDAVQSRLETLEREIAGERFLNEVSRAADFNVRSLFAADGAYVPEFDAWLKSQSAGIQLLADKGNAHEVSTVVKAYRDHLQGATTKAVDQLKAQEHKRQRELHAHSASSKTGAAQGGSDGKALLQRGFEAALAED